MIFVTVECVRHRGLPQQGQSVIKAHDCPTIRQHTDHLHKFSLKREKPFTPRLPLPGSLMKVGQVAEAWDPGSLLPVLQGVSRVPLHREVK